MLYLSYRYSYSPVGNRTSMRSLRDDVLQEYTYDAVDRLTRWQRGNDRFEEYTYDQVGNRHQFTDERGTTAYAYNLANRRTQTVQQLTTGATTTTDLTWDPNGNLLSEQIEGGSLTTYTWDALNRLTALDGPTGSHTYGYDPTGIRVRETNGTETTRFLHADEDIVATYEGGALATYYAHGPGIDEPWAQVKPAEADSLAYLHRDGLGSVTAISSPQAQLYGTTSYAAFGGVEASTGLQSRYGYTSRELDETGNMYYRARYYQPEVGRFASRDSFPGFLNQGQSLNRYAYAYGNAINLTDPSGFAPGIIETLGGFISSFIILLGAIVDGLGTAGAQDINLMGPNARLALLRGVLKLFGNSIILFGVYSAFQDAFSDDTLTYREQVLRFFVSVFWNLTAAWLVSMLVANITTLGRAAVAGLIVLLVGLNILLVIMVNALIDGTFNVLRSTLPENR